MTALEGLTALRTEVERLKRQHEQDTMEIERLRTLPNRDGRGRTASRLL